MLKNQLHSNVTGNIEDMIPLISLIDEQTRVFLQLFLISIKIGLIYFVCYYCYSFF
jgi:hypothetical protein